MLHLNHNCSAKDAEKRFILHCSVRNLSKATIGYYRYKIDKFVDYVGNPPMCDINPTVIDNFKISIANNSPASINTYIRAIRAFIYWCADNNLCKNFKIRLVKQPNVVKEPYTPDELKKLLRKPNVKHCSFAEYRDWVMVNFLVATGCRLSTLCAMQRQDVNIANATVHYRHLKSGEEQTVPLSKTMCAIFIDYFSIREWQPNEAVWISQFEKPMTNNSICAAIRTYNLSRGVSKTSIHLFRHTFAKMYIQAGGDPFRLQKLLNHKDLTMTRHYVNLYGGDLSFNYEKLNPLEQIQSHIRHSKIHLQK
mgnify:CR=1 FL=1